MKRFACLVVLAALTSVLPACKQVLNAPQYQKGTVSHVVLCYLKNKGSAADRQKLLEATRPLREIPGVYDIEVGYVLPSNRPVVVSDYDVGIIVFFRNPEALEAYEKNPKHVKAVKDVLEPLTSKIVVYDFVNQEY
jgi:hypothetical protein